MPSFSPPASIDDLAGRATRGDFLADWDGFIAGSFTTEINNLKSIRPPLDPQFASEADGAFPGGDVPVTWNAFPLFISRQHHNDSVGAWKAANAAGQARFGATVVQTRLQDEYCEWFEYREGGKLTKIVFTAEAPEYWVHLATHDLDRVVELYQQWVSPAVQKEDLLLAADLEWFDNQVLAAGSYNPYNPWNTSKGVMHLTHPANTLGAEIDLAARASVLRRDAAGHRVLDVRQLACCSNFGDPNRSSDPNIGSAVNTSCVTPDGHTIQDVTLANPVALYIDSLQAGALTGPDDGPLDDWFQIVRGVAGRGLMAVVAAPAGAAFGLDQVKVKGIPLSFGGQIAEAIQMVLYAKVRPHAGAGAAARSFPCLNNCCVPKGTDPANYKTINFDVPDDQTGTCMTGEEAAYIVRPAVPHAELLAEAAHAPAEEHHSPGPGKRVARAIPIE